MNKALYCLFISTHDPEKVLFIYNKIISELKKNFQQFKIINFKKNINFKSLEEKYDDLIYVTSKKELKNILNQYNNIYAIDCLGRGFNDFNSRYLINHKKISLIQIMNLGFISNSIFSNKNSFKFFFFNYTKKIEYLIFRILVFFKIFKRIDIYFESRKDIYQNIKKKNENKIREFLDIFFNARLYKKIFLINSRAYDSYFLNNLNQKKNSIVFLDGNFKHKDIQLRESINFEQIEKIYFNNLKGVFNNLKKITNFDKIEICLHPTSDEKIYEKHFHKDNISKFQTQEKIAEAALVLFHESGSIADALLGKKTIISLKTDIFGNYFHNRINQYIKLLNPIVINLDNNLDNEFKDFKKKLSQYEYKYMNYINNFINADGKEPGCDKIVRVMKKLN